MILIMMKLVYIEEVVKSIDKWMRGRQAQLTMSVGQKASKWEVCQLHLRLLLLIAHHHPQDVGAR